MKTAFGICLLLALTACGGGGGSGNAGDGGNGGGSGNTPPPTFTLSGSVGGLTGSGLVLASNAQTLAVAANGTFTFPTAMARGTAYNVTVATQPDTPAQNCGVTNGSGTLNNNVSNIAIACSDVPALTLAGSTPASGANDAARERLVLEFSAPLNAATVSTTSVTLRDALGPHVIDVSVSGAQLIVTPRRSLLPAAAYTLTIDNVIRGSGREAMSAPLTLSFSTRGAWQAAQLIENETSDSGAPAVAAHGETLMVVWEQQDGLALKRYVSGTGWSSAVVGAFGSMTTFGELNSPQLAVDAQGTGHIVWYEDENNLVSSLKASHYTPATGFSAEERAETDSTGRVSVPRVAVDPAGNVFAIWRYAVPLYSAWANRYSAGSGWGTAREIDVSSSSIVRPDVAVDASGNALALWVERTPAGQQPWSSIYTPGTDWGTPVRIGPASSAIDTMTFRMNLAGQAVALTSVSDPSEEHVMAMQATLGGSWSAPVQIDTDPRAGAMSGQKVAIDAAGNAVAVWIERYVGSPEEIWSSRYSVASGWSASERIGVTAQSAADLDVAVDRAGNALVLWANFSGSTVPNRIMANRYIVGRGWSTAASIDSNNGNQVLNPRLAIDGDGNAVAVWNQFDGTVQDVVASRFE